TNYGATGIAVDAVGGKVYWFDDSPGSMSIKQANLDGTGTEVFVENSGYAYSLVIPFDYSASPPIVLPTVTTTTASTVTATSATLGGDVTANGGAAVSERGIVWATTANPTTANNKVAIGDGTGSSSQNIGLPAGTTIHYRAYATNSEGTSYGSEESLTTSAATAPGNALRFDGT